MRRSWSIRTYKEGDEAAIFQLWQAVYPEEKHEWEEWLRWWRWMYQDNPAGTGKIWLAEHEGRIVGQYAIAPIVMKIGDEILTGALSLDTMTHPDYRHQGIFETLAKEVYTEAHKDGIHIVYGFPNQFSYLGFLKKLNWFDICTLEKIVKPLNWKNTARLKVKNKFLQRVLAMGAVLVFNKVLFRTQKPPIAEGLAFGEITSFDRRFDEFWAKISTQSLIMVVRNKDYLNWRYRTPDANYSIFVAEKGNEVQGYLVLQYTMQNGVKVSHIFDLLAQSEEIMHCLISRAIEHGVQNNAALILYSLIANETYHRVLKRNGFISLPFNKGAHFCAYSSSPQISKTLLEDPKNWLVQIGDSDAV